MGIYTCHRCGQPEDPAEICQCAIVTMTAKGLVTESKDHIPAPEPIKRSFKVGDLAYLPSQCAVPMTVIKVSEQYGLTVIWLDKENRLQEITCIDPEALVTSRQVDGI